MMEIRKTENNFNISFYENVFVSFHDAHTYKSVTKHIRDIDFVKEIKDEQDIVRLFEYVVRVQENRRSVMLIP
jgi:hypothetical protein